MRAFDWLNVKLGVRSQVAVAFTLAIALILVGMVVFHRLEDWTWSQSFYYAVITLSTVGYGDFTPTKDATRIVAAFYILIGVTVFVSAIGIIGMNVIERRQQAIMDRYEERQRNLEERVTHLERLKGMVPGVTMDGKGPDGSKVTEVKDADDKGPP